MSAPVADDVAERPIVVLGCAWRCGSTLLQRYLNSTQQVFIWGEHAGLLTSIGEALQRVEDWRPLIERQSSSLQRRGSGAWIANLNPPDFNAVHSEVIAAALRAYYLNPTLSRGLRRWGFKEVRYTAREARMILSAFPQARIVFLTRRIEDVLASNAANPWCAEIGGLDGVIDQWLESTTSLLSLDDQRVRVLRYEDIAARPRWFTKQLARHVDVPEQAFDCSVLNVRVRGAVDAPAPARSYAAPTQTAPIMRELYPEAL